jgi:hypothetical protein
MASQSENDPSSNLSLPDNFRKFVEEGRQLLYNPSDCECGTLILLPLDRLRLEDFPILTSEIQHVWGDPRQGEGYYLVPAVNLVEKCEAYEPFGNLIWIPPEGLFGSWDLDHYIMQVFPKATWEDIVVNPVRYINAQWRLDASTSKWLIPWPKYPWRPGRMLFPELARNDEA